MVNLKHLTPTVGLTHQGLVQSMSAQPRGRGAAATAMVPCSLMMTLPFHSTSLSQARARSSNHVRCHAQAISLWCCDNSPIKASFLVQYMANDRFWFLLTKIPLLDKSLGVTRFWLHLLMSHDMHGCFELHSMTWLDVTMRITVMLWYQINIILEWWFDIGCRSTIMTVNMYAYAN
jgi:hypothetical protein